MPQATFYAWRRRLRPAARRASAPQRTSRKPSQREDMPFVELRLSTDSSGAGPESSPTGGIELYLPGRRCLVIRPGFDRPTLVDLLSALDASVSRFAAGETQRGSTGLFTTREEGP